MMTRVEIPIVFLVAVYVAFAFVLIRRSGKRADERRQRLTEAFGVLTEELIRP